MTKLPLEIATKIKRLALEHGFELDNNTDRGMTFSTRDENDVGDESPNAGIRAAARSLASAIKTAHPDVVVVAEVVDEWVSITVMAKS